MTNRNSLSAIVFTVYIFLAFYVFGAGITNSLVAYRTWRGVGAKEFPAFHQIDSALIVPFFVIFFFLLLIPLLLLFWFRPPMIPKWMVWVALLFYLITLLSTVLIQIPIQVELDKRFSLELIDRLIATDLLYRRIPMAFLAGVSFFMLYKVLRQSGIWASTSL
ncbi:MAG: hypothetical protein H7Z72_04845 [Bacteroidetes bacterium]|nr:hypothetical protein [Fibrella sp.]